MDQIFLVVFFGLLVIGGFALWYYGSASGAKDVEKNNLILVES